MDEHSNTNEEPQMNDPKQVDELEKELEATGKRSLNYSIILILVIIPFLLLLFFISTSNESPFIATRHSPHNTH